jgi:hypothetical protein
MQRIEGKMAYFYGDQRLTHLSQMEAFLWTKFLELYGGQYTDYEYDVHLRRPITLPKEWPDEYRQNALTLSSLRIDVTMRDKTTIWIVEIRPDAKHSAIGSLIMYRFLYILQHNPQARVKMILVTNSFDPAIEFTARSMEMGYYVF